MRHRQVEGTSARRPGSARHGRYAFEKGYDGLAARIAAGAPLAAIVLVALSALLSAG